jgi:hypothetical protein
MFLRELFHRPQRPLLEGGGNIWPETTSFYPTPDMVQSLVKEVQGYLRDAGLPIHVQGSGANEDPDPEHPTGDLDVSVDMNQVKQFFNIPAGKSLADDDKAARNALEKFLLDNGVEATYKAGVTVHIKFPYDGQAYQCDIKVIRKAEKVSKVHRHIIPRGSPYKGVHKQVVLSTLASAKNMLWSPDEGLYARDANRKKADLITDDWDKVAEILLGPGHNGRDLGSAESIMAAIKDPELKKQVWDSASGGASWQKAPLRGPARPLLEAAPGIGRKYQHIEDLVFTNGSHGGLHAVERLQSMASRSGNVDLRNVELKWDGSPVMYWGRDENGTFYMIPKNAWVNYVSKGQTKTKTGVATATKTPNEVQKFILGTGDQSTPEKVTQRQIYASEIASLWPYFEKISPKRGFFEGGVLFHPGAQPTINNETGEYEFTPNLTTFHVGQSTELGKRIAKAKAMVAVTGFYPTLGSGDEGRYPNAEELSTPDIIVQGTTYTEHDDIPLSGLIDTESYISQNANLIDGFLAPKPGLKNPGDVLYKFYNDNLRILGVKQKFHDWVTRNVSAGQSEKILADHAGLNAVLDAVEMITHAKLELLNALSAGTHGGIRQTKPEGYVQAHNGTQFKYDLPGQFVKAIDQANWAPRKG